MSGLKNKMIVALILALTAVVASGCVPVGPYGLPSPILS
jgi:hypothetical protein